MAEPLQLSIIIPAHNEERRLPESLTRIHEFLLSQQIPAEVIVVENGSNDRTAEVTLEHAARFPEVRLLRSQRKGKGLAVRMGMLAARGAYRFQCDADLSMPIEEILQFLPPTGGGAEVRIASREVQGATRIGEPAYRHLTGRIFTFFVKLLVLPGFEDTQCGFKCYRAEAAERIFALQRLEGWTFDVENLYLARRFGYRIGEVPITWYYRSESRVHLVRDSISMFFDLLRIRWNGWRGLYGQGRPQSPAHPQA